MKKIAMVFAFVLVSFCGYAQNIKFNGVPLGIELGQFETLLKEKGYEVLESEFNNIDARNMSYYGGVFAGSKVLLSVMHTPVSKLVQIVSASYCDFSTKVPDVTELSIERKFDEVKASLANKYPDAKKTEWNEGYFIKAYMLEASKWQINLSIQERDGIKSLNILYLDKDASAIAKREYDTDY